MKLSLLFTLLLAGSLWASDEIQVNWVCSPDATRTIKLSYDSSGKLQFSPDLFNGGLSYKAGVDYSSCLRDFQRNVDTALTEYKQAECPASKDSLCFASNDYTNGKVIEVLKKSRFLQDHKEIKLQANTPETAAKLAGLGGSAKSYLEDQITQKKIDPKNLSETFNYNGKQYKVSDFDDVVGENIENVFSEMSRDEAKQYAQNYMMARASYLKPGRDQATRTEVLNNLNKMFGYLYGEKGESELAKMLECAPEDNLSPIEDVMRHVERSNKKSKCDPLSPGEHKVFAKEASDFYGTGHYLLRRKPDGNYQAVLNVNFKLGSSSTMGPVAMMARAKNCLSIASPHMKGPNGEKLEMTVLTPSEIEELPKDQRPKPYDISIEGPNFGTNAASYEDDIDCSTITHEMLHLLGLCDEYKEDRSKYAGMWECRVVTKAPSIMRDNYSVFPKVVGSSMMCGCQNSTCTSVMDSSNENMKKLFVSQTIYDVSNHTFRSRYCKEVAYTGSSELSQPDKGAVVLSHSDSESRFERRYVGTNISSPYYKVERGVFVCKCPAGNQDCVREKNEMANNIRNISTSNRCPPYSVFKKGVTDRLETRFGSPDFTLHTKGNGESLLQPNHFKKILAGNCPGVVDGYLECAEHAYKSLKDGPCNAPAKCNDDSYYLGSKQ